jgi:UDP-N-acetylglucosamine 2-epimerase
MKKKKTNTRKAAIWLDHLHAHLLKFKDDKINIETVESGLETRVRYKGETAIGTKLGNKRTTNNEYHKHRKEENQLKEYYKQLSATIKKYDTIFLFGPTTAKNELLNYVREKEKLNGKTFIVDSAEELSFNQMIAKAKTVLG